MAFQRTFTGTPWEEKVGYCRALRAGDRVLVTGTTALNDDGSVHSPGDSYEQTVKCFEIIAKALSDLGASMRHVVRTRMYVTDISQWEDIGRAHGEIFRAHPPCATMVEVKGLVDPAMLIEIEAEAVVED
ncbi:MAG: RidA family protein [Planctomycetes bacterium]|nr:RidA family protein [Planctomycetota bacterium]